MDQLAADGQVTRRLAGDVELEQLLGGSFQNVRPELL
jgi:hypothetical protein